MLSVNMVSQAKTEMVRAQEGHLPVIAGLAGVIWRACYPGIITHAQIDYMLARMYSLDVLRDEIRSQGIRHDLLFVDGKPSGFASYGPASEPGVMKLHKLYLLPELRGRTPADSFREQTQHQGHRRLPTERLHRR
jgi:diamine N-acetyltransferase